MIDRRDTLARTPARELALACLEAGIEAGDPRQVLGDTVSVADGALIVNGWSYDLDASGRVLVVGGGKAAGRQAQAVEEVLGDRIDEGIVVTNDPVATDHVEVREADHPVPSAGGVAATRELLETIEAADRHTLVLVLVSGGGSALLTAPAEGVTLEELQTVTRGLLDAGATIEELNAVRKHLSAIKGGQLAERAAPARVVALVMSDVVGDDPSVIASGPTVPDPTTFADARAVLDRYGVETPTAVADRLAAGERGEVGETPAPGEATFDRANTHVIADSATPMRAAADEVRERDLRPVLLSSRVRGEAREAAKTHVAIGEEILATGNPVDPPAVLLSGGETTVTVREDGQGGPNHEFAVSAALEIDDGLTLAAIDTDGIDGASPAAGGLVDGATVEEPEAARAALAANDTYPYLRDREDAIETGPTGTNLNDLRVLVVGLRE